MPIKSVLTYVQIIESDVKYTKEFLNTVYGARRRLVNSIEKSKKDLKSASNPSKYISKLKPSIIKEIKNGAKFIIERNITDAAAESKEFNDEVYLNPLIAAAKKPDTFTVVIKGSSWEILPSVTINLNSTAGRLNLWASGIKAYRKAIGVKIPKKNSKLYNARAVGASKGWAKIYNDNGSRFTKTIKGRLSASGAKAPYWQLLDKGTPPTLPSDRGGYPTPEFSATNFVEKTEQEVKTLGRDLVINLRDQFNDYINSIEPDLIEAKETLKRLDSLVDEIKLGRKANSLVERYFKDIIQYIDRNKLDKALDKIRRGLLVSGTVDITKSGSKKRVRPRVSKLSNLLGE